MCLTSGTLQIFTLKGVMEHKKDKTNLCLNNLGENYPLQQHYENPQSM